MHRDFVRIVRAGYHQRRAAAQRGMLSSVASLIVDGIDQSLLDFHLRFFTSEFVLLILGALLTMLINDFYLGMDQKKTSIPYDSVEQGSAADTSSNRITQGVMGGIIHGIGRFLYVSDGLLCDLKGADYGTNPYFYKSFL